MLQLIGKLPLSKSWVATYNNGTVNNPTLGHAGSSYKERDVDRLIRLGQEFIQRDPIRPMQPPHYNYQDMYNMSEDERRAYHHANQYFITWNSHYRNSTLQRYGYVPVFEARVIHRFTSFGKSSNQITFQSADDPHIMYQMGSSAIGQIITGLIAGTIKREEGEEGVVVLDMPVRLSKIGGALELEPYFGSYEPLN